VTPAILQTSRIQFLFRKIPEITPGIRSHLWSGVYLGAGDAGIVTPKLAWIPAAWGLLEAPLATMAGAAFYKEF